MYKNLVVTSDRINPLPISMRGPDHNSGLLLLDIKGLGNSERIINKHAGPNISGALINSVRRQVRTINLTFICLEDPYLGTHKGRDILNRLFGGVKKIGIERDQAVLTSLGFPWSQQDAYVWTDCVLESQTNNIYSRNENVEITLMCPSPYFVGDTVTTQLNRGLTPVINSGDVETPIKITLVFTQDGVTEDILISRLPSNIFRFRLITSEVVNIIGRQILSGDKIEITSNIGNKSVTHIASNPGEYGVVTNIISAVDWHTSRWLTLSDEHGNFFWYEADQLANATIYHQNLYEAV